MYPHLQRILTLAVLAGSFVAACGVTAYFVWLAWTDHVIFLVPTIIFGGLSFVVSCAAAEAARRVGR